MLGNQVHDVEHVGLCAHLVGIAYGDGLGVVLVQETGSSLGGIDGIAGLAQSLGGIEQGSLLLGTAAGEHDALVLGRNLVAGGNHGIEQSLLETVAQATYLAG